LSFINTHGFGKVVNAFMCPAEGNSVLQLSEAEMSISQRRIGVTLENFKMIKLTAPKMFGWHLGGVVIDIFMGTFYHITER